MDCKRPFRVIAFIFLMLCCSSHLFAEIVKEIQDDGVLLLADGKKVVLAGLQLDIEGASILRVLTQSLAVKVQRTNSPDRTDADAPQRVYLFVDTRYIKFPFLRGGNPDQEEVMINELMVRIGAAKVDESQDFSKKDNFLKLQEEAKTKGEGIWSYEAA